MAWISRALSLSRKVDVALTATVPRSSCLNSCSATFHLPCGCLSVMTNRPSH